MRAFYRRQIVSNAWASTRRPALRGHLDSIAFSNTSTEQGRSLGLFAAFQPWDMQHIDHANYFVMSLCCALVHHAAEAATGTSTRTWVTSCGTCERTQESPRRPSVTPACWRGTRSHTTSTCRRSL
jgi:hypothetical protein